MRRTGGQADGRSGGRAVDSPEQRRPADLAELTARPPVRLSALWVLVMTVSLAACEESGARPTTIRTTSASTANDRNMPVRIRLLDSSSSNASSIVRICWTAMSGSSARSSARAGAASRSASEARTMTDIARVGSCDAST